MKDYRPDIINDFERLDNVLQHLADYQRDFANAHERPGAILAASAYQLQHLYTGFEKVAEKCLASKGIKLIISGTYHKDLLVTFWQHFQFAPSEIETMEDLRAFRHFARSAYGNELETDELMNKVATALTVWPGIKAKIFAQMKLAQ